MSRRASLLAKQNKCKPKVRFPDELVFLDNIKENDLPAVSSMLRRASVQVDINALNDAGRSIKQTPTCCLTASSLRVAYIYSQIKFNVLSSL